MTEENLVATSNLIKKCLGLVESLIAIGDSAESIEIIQALLEANPRHPELHKKKALALISENNYEAALASLDECITHSPQKQKSECFLYKADLLYSLQKYTESLRIYQLLLAHNPNREQIMYRKGLCILAFGRYKQASQIFQKVLSLNPQYQQCYIMNAHSLFIQKKYQKALKCLTKIAEKSDFQNTDALYMKACCHYNIRQYHQCEKQLKRILQLDFGNVESKILLIITMQKIKMQEQAK